MSYAEQVSLNVRQLDLCRGLLQLLLASVSYHPRLKTRKTTNRAGRWYGFGSENRLRRCTWKSNGFKLSAIETVQTWGLYHQANSINHKTNISQLWDGINPCLLVAFISRYFRSHFVSVLTQKEHTDTQTFLLMCAVVASESSLWRSFWAERSRVCFCVKSMFEQERVGFLVDTDFRDHSGYGIQSSLLKEFRSALQVQFRTFCILLLKLLKVIWKLVARQDNGARSPRFRKLSKQMNIAHFWPLMLVSWSVLRRKSDELMELYLTLVGSSVGFCLWWYVACVLSCLAGFCSESPESQKAVITEARALPVWRIKLILWSFSIPIEIALWVRWLALYPLKDGDFPYHNFVKYQRGRTIYV